MSNLDPHDAQSISEVFNIAPALAREVVYENDEQLGRCTPVQRWQHIRHWVANQLGDEWCVRCQGLLRDPDANIPCKACCNG